MRADDPRVIDRVLPRQPRETLESYVSAGGGRGIDAARRVDPEVIIAELEASGLRGRGGAGFPTGTKWRTVAAFDTSAVPPTVVVNGAEGEPGTFKDRAIMRANPYAVVEGGLIAARAVGADRLVIAIKASFVAEHDALRRAIAEIEAVGWAEGVAMAVVPGPSEYLFGEETALLEVLDGRPPFPRLAPPFRQGVDERGVDPAEPGGAVLAGGGAEATPPTLVNNAETIANVPGIVADGAAWFRSVGTEQSPGSVVCTISGRVRRHGVIEVPMGTPLDDVIGAVGEGAEEGRQLVAAMSGVANPLLPAARFGTPLSFESMAAAGAGLGAAGFILFDDATDLAAVAAGVSRFLAVESCGQCEPCKRDGLEIAGRLDRIRRTEAAEDDLVVVMDRLRTVADNARCFLAQQHQLVIESLLRLFPKDLQTHVAGDAAPAPLELIAPIVEFGPDGRAVLDTEQAGKQPDWTFGDTDSGQAPVDRLRTPAL